MKSISILLVAFILVCTLPVWLVIGGGLIGLAFGLLGGLIGILFGLIGAIIGGIAWVFKTIFHLLFGWGWDFDFNPGVGFNGYIFAALLILVLAVASKKKN